MGLEQRTVSCHAGRQNQQRTEVLTVKNIVSLYLDLHYWCSRPKQNSGLDVQEEKASKARKN
jgi:hypothetical protein